jgi:transcriptional regulator with XRE-family HTH domain
MNELNISKCIIRKRKEKGITQEELAEYIGVSKAAVSKWESGQSYPDISLLPELAAFFNVSVDELLGYSPQLSREEVKKNYNHLSCEFAVKPFEEVMGKCFEEIDLPVFGRSISASTSRNRIFPGHPKTFRKGFFPFPVQ